MKHLFHGKSLTFLTIAAFLVGGFFVNTSAALAIDHYVDATVKSTTTNDGTSIATAFRTIQEAIDKSSTGDTIYVYPGAYNETAEARKILAGTDKESGPYQFGLFLPINKPNLKIIGVDGTGTAITDPKSAFLPYVRTNATNDFGPSGIWVEGASDTIQGLHIGNNTSGTNKTIEVVADNFTLQYSKTDISDGGGSIYINDFSILGDVVKSYHILDNIFPDGTSIDLASGAGLTGEIINREILRNNFSFLNNTYNSISFNGAGGTPWYTLSVGGAIIKGNSFAGSNQYIRARGTYDKSQFDWKSYWDDNTFDKAVIDLTDVSSFNVQTYSYVSGEYTFTNVRRIGTDVQKELTNSSAGNTIFIAAGTYELTEQLNLDKSISIIGNGSVILKAANTSWGAINGSKHLLAVYGGTEIAPINISNITLDANSQNYAVNTYANAYGILNNVIIKNSKGAGLTVNGSTITVNNITTADNAWGGINADQGDHVTATTSLTVKGASFHIEKGPAIWVDDISELVSVTDTNNQYTYSTYVKGSATGSIYTFTSATVSNQNQLVAALADKNVSSITFGADITINSAVVINHSVTINGAGHKLNAPFEKTDNSNNAAIIVLSSNVTIKNLVEDGTGSVKLHGINIFLSNNVSLDTVTVSNNPYAGIIVNGSIVTVKNITTSGNGWHGINVDQGKDVIAITSLTVNGTSSHSEATAIWKDSNLKKDVSIIDTNNQYTASALTKDGAIGTKYILTPAPIIIAPVSNGGGGGVYIQPAPCSSVTYGEWGTAVNGIQYRNLLVLTPNSCTLTTAQEAARSRIFTNEVVEPVTPIITPAPVATSTPTQQVLGEKKFADGTLVRGSNNRIYVVINNTLTHISSLQELAKHAGKVILKTEDGIIASFSKTSVLGIKKYANGTLIKTKGDVKIYVIKDGKKIHIKSLVDLKNYKGKVLNIATSELSLY